MAVVVVDYGAGNLKSAAKALMEAAKGSGVEVAVTADPQTVRHADRIVLPGVGAFADCKAGLESLPGMVEALSETVLEKRRPFLGICVGMQLMATLGIEYGEHPGLDWIKGRVVKLRPGDANLKIPQIGWNNLSASPHPVLRGLPKDADAYFVHSYHFVAEDSADVLSRIDYGGPVVAAIGRDNLLGVQFHPEKSQAVGLKLLGDFLKWHP
ncbi:imidazole glycerol phosphate synthase subunit HisH [Dongia sp.]|uniref:imidazole glycerol phosphate synthase subunit HisH n=1 Tax=Dongia sp. TaxID=1977262 RepID=UPI0037520E0B